MSFIGVVSNKRFYENISKEISEKNKEKDITIIYINLKNLDNFKNIRFELIIIESEIKTQLEMLNNKNILEKLCGNTKFILLNSDSNDVNQLKCNNIITYGLSKNSDITISSIQENNILIYWQKNINIKNREITEIEETKLYIDNNNKLNIYEIISIYNIFRINKGEKICNL